MIVGLVGFAGVGKDTLADILVRDHGFVKMSIADPLKRAAMDIFDFTHGQLWGQSKRREEPDNRYPREHTWSSDTVAIESTCLCCKVSVHAPRAAVLPHTAVRASAPRYGVRAALLQQDLDRVHATKRTPGVEGEGCRLPAANGVYVAPSMPQRYRGVVITDVRFRNELDGIKRFSRHQGELLEKLIEAWHNQQQVGAGREEPLDQFLGMTLEEYTIYVESKIHRTSSFVVKVSRPGFETPRFQHQSELEQLEFKMEEFDYNFVGDRAGGDDG